MKTRAQRKKEYISVKNQCTAYGFNFSTHDLITPQTTWADICFIGKNKSVYNATILTTEAAWHDLIKDLAWEKLKSRITPEDKIFEIVELDNYTSNQAFSGPTTISDPPVKNLNGLTATQFLEKTCKELSSEPNITIHEEFEILPNFSFGIGLNMIVHEPFLSKEVIAKHVDKFIAMGEVNWKSEQKYSFQYRDNLHFTTNAIA